MVKVLLLDIEKEIWDKFKRKVPRTISLNKAVINLIEDYIKEEL